MPTPYPPPDIIRAVRAIRADLLAAIDRADALLAAVTENDPTGLGYSRPPDEPTAYNVPSDIAGYAMTGREHAQWA